MDSEISDEEAAWLAAEEAEAEAGALALVPAVATDGTVRSTNRTRPHDSKNKHHQHVSSSVLLVSFDMFSTGHVSWIGTVDWQQDTDFFTI